MIINSRYTDWIPIIDDIENSCDLTILELGCGAGTLHLVDRFKFVYSYETNTRDSDGKWFNLTKQQLENKNWLGYFDVDFPDSSKKINVSSLINNIKNKINLDAVDIVFVDPGFRNRAECILELAYMNKFYYIFTHDTNTESDLYEWHLLKAMPSTYKLHSQINTGQGTKLWKKLNYE